METMGLEGEEREFEMARRFVRIAADAAQQAGLAQPGADPQMVVRRAVDGAMRMHVPNLARVARGGAAGRWRRISGGRIVIDL